MARKAAQQAAKAAPLDDISIATSGKFPGTTQAVLASRITSLGATMSAKVTADTSFLIATEKDYQSSSTKVKTAASHNVPVVTLDWLEECESTGKRLLPDAFLEHHYLFPSLKAAGLTHAIGSKVDETQYLLSSSAISAAAPAPKAANGKKRAASPDASPAASQSASQAKKPKIVENAKIGDGQNAKSVKIAISVDEYCPLASYHVYIKDDGTIFDASLNQTNSGANANKFYKMQVSCNAQVSYESMCANLCQVLGAGGVYKTWTRWGRVGERGQNALLGNGSLDDAIHHFEKKFKDKSGVRWDQRGAEPKAGKYAYVEKSYNPDSDDEEEDAGSGAIGDSYDEDGNKRTPAECTLEPPVANLMKLIFNQSYFDATMTALNYDANKLPLGKLSKGTIARGFQALKDLSVLLDNTDAESREEIERLSNLFYSVIPHAFGRDRPPVIRDNALLKREIELLESLSDMKEAASMLKSTLKDDGGVHQLDKQFKGLGMNEVTPLDRKSQEFSELEAYLLNTKGATHHMNYKVDDIFRIERQGELDRFECSEFSSMPSNRRLLWHGSRVTNFGGILSQGLRIAPPEAPVSGYMFGLLLPSFDEV